MKENTGDGHVRFELAMVCPRMVELRPAIIKFGAAARERLKTLRPKMAERSGLSGREDTVHADLLLCRTTMISLLQHALAMRGAQSARDSAGCSINAGNDHRASSVDVAKGCQGEYSFSHSPPLHTRRNASQNGWQGGVADLSVLQWFFRIGGM